ncbi:hypothetical protein V2J09_012913 [Rumex salicifolius]
MEAETVKVARKDQEPERESTEELGKGFTFGPMTVGPSFRVGKENKNTGNHERPGRQNPQRKGGETLDPRDRVGGAQGAAPMIAGHNDGTNWEGSTNSSQELGAEDCCDLIQRETSMSIAVDEEEVLPDMTALFETHTSVVKADRICENLGFSKNFRVESQGHSGGIWKLWKDDKIKLEVLSSHQQFVHACILENQTSNLIVVYACPTATRRKNLWPDLQAVVQPLREPTIIGRDFNCIMRLDERSGGSVWDSDALTTVALAQLRVKLEEWNRNILGNINIRKDKLLRRLNGLSRALDRGPTDYLLSLQKDFHNELEKVLEEEELMWF